MSVAALPAQLQADLSLYAGPLVRCGTVTFDAQCPAGGHDAVWTGTRHRVDGHDGPSTVTVDCAVCQAQEQLQAATQAADGA